MDRIAELFAQEAAICIGGAFIAAAIGYLACWLRHRKDGQRGEDRAYRAIENRKLRH